MGWELIQTVVKWLESEHHLYGCAIRAIRTLKWWYNSTQVHQGMERQNL